jgi:hypothetical protein
MTSELEVDCALHECLFAIGQAVGRRKQLDYNAVTWLRDRYGPRFLHAIAVNGNSWTEDRTRVMAVGRFLGRQALCHAGDQPSIDSRSAAMAASEIEAGCRMRARNASG